MANPPRRLETRYNYEWWRVQASRASRRVFNSRDMRWFRRPFRIARDFAGNGLEATTN
jgi:hypothetical protein